MAKYIIKITNLKTEEELTYTSYEKPTQTETNTSLTDRYGLYKSFPHSLYAVAIEEVKQ